ncbi:MAG: hypothetical protein NT094_05250, partial [Candidatus Staskawiczbacteria bacterium]|nr:hypothetical protein [Candidatus Staskawiczbacteria bacterium]
MIMSVLKKRVNTKITIAILSLEVFAALLSLFLIVYPNINVKPIKASTTIPNGTLQLNGSTNPSSIASDATVTINWDPTQFKDSSGDNSPVQVYACYNSSTNNIGDFSNCMVKEWPHFENTGSYQFSIADSMIPNPRNCYRNEKLFTIGITKFSNSGVTAISSKVSITGIKAPGICPTAPTIISITLLNNTWFGGMAKQVSIFGSNLNYPGLDIKICNPNNSNTCLPLSIDPSTYYCISSVGCFFTTSAIGTNLTDISSNGSSILKVCTKTTIPSCQTSIFTYYPASNPAITTAPTISKLKLATNSWPQSGFNINLCNPDHPNYCMIASLSSTINSCSATSCTLTTSAIGGNLTGIGNNNNVFFSGQTTILKVCPKSAFIPSCWAIPFNYTPAGAPAITDFTLGNNSWQGGATNTINIAGSNLNLLPQQGFNLNICNPTIL